MKYLLIVLILLVMTGCSASLTEDNLESFANSKAVLTTCAIAKEYSEHDVSRYAQAWQYNISSWANVDWKRVNKRTHEITNNYSPYAPNIKPWCAQARIDFEGSISNANTHKRNTQSQSTSTLKSTSQCKKLGAFLTPEIKTFSGVMCPIGWVSA